MVAEGYEVGVEYLVPTALSGGRSKWGWLPVIGAEHEDREIIGNGAMHFHVDWRFAPEELYEAAVRGHRHYGGEFEAVLVGWEAGESMMVKCLREYRRFPREHAFWIEKLERKHADSVLGEVCPHRGFPMRGCRVAGGVIECPGHGLRWDVLSGRLKRGE